MAALADSSDLIGAIIPASLPRGHGPGLRAAAGQRIVRTG
jgi:hypothetical protein